VEYQRILLADYTLTGEGGTALTYMHKDGHTLAKLYMPGFGAEAARREFLVSRTVFEMGIPTPEPIRLVTDGQRYGAEYELIAHKRSFTRIISEEPGQLEPLSRLFARLSRSLHATGVPGDRLPDMRALVRAGFGRFGTLPPDVEALLQQALDAVPEARTCLHGDLHIGNIITDGERILWIDLGMFCYGVPEWDLGWTWTMCNRIDEKKADFILHLTPEMLNAHWNIFLPAYLGTNDKAAIGEYIKRILPFYAVKLPYMFDMVLQSRLPDEALKALPQVIV